MDWKIVGLLLVLFFGVGAFISNIAALFGYGGWATLLLVPICFASAMAIGARVSRRLKNKSGASPSCSELPPQYNPELVRHRAYQRYSKEQKLRIFFATMWSMIVFLMVFLLVYFVAHQFLSSLIPGTETAIALLISMPIAWVYGVILYQKGQTKKPPDDNDNNSN